MPALRKLRIGLLSTVFVAAWVFFTPPGRRGLERLGVYTECAIDVWSLRKHCNAQPTAAADEPATSLAPGSPTAATAGPLLVTTSAQPRAAPKHTQTYWTARHSGE